jgi:hypothetical protein
LFVCLSRPGQAIFSLSVFFFPDYDGSPPAGTILNLFLRLIESFTSFLLVVFKGEFLNGEHTNISRRLADLAILTAVFVFGKGRKFDEEIHVLSASSLLPSSSDLFLKHWYMY